MSKPYYMLFCQEADGSWHPQFGDYVKAVVSEEASESYARQYKANARVVLRLPKDDNETAEYARGC